MSLLPGFIAIDVSHQIQTSFSNAVLKPQKILRKIDTTYRQFLPRQSPLAPIAPAPTTWAQVVSEHTLKSEGSQSQEQRIETKGKVDADEGHQSWMRKTGTMVDSSAGTVFKLRNGKIKSFQRTFGDWIDRRCFSKVRVTSTIPFPMIPTDQ